MIRAYLDCNATTAPAPGVVEAMLHYLQERYLNVSSAAAVQLLADDDPIRDAKLEVARLLGSRDFAEDLTLTSGASEANSWVVAALAPPGSHVVTSRLEHPSLRLALEHAERRGAIVDWVAPDRDGRVDASAVAKLLRPETRLVSVMLANNETGVVQPLREIGRATRNLSHALLHSDATQAVGRMPVDLGGELDGIDLLSLSAHKFHGPKGIGALYARSGLSLPPLIHGEQEQGRRGGTYNSAAAAGMAAAAKAIAGGLRVDLRAMRVMRDLVEEAMIAMMPDARVNGVAVERLPNTTSITIPGQDANELVDALATIGICVSAGSACSAGAERPAPSLLAMGLSLADARSTIRISLSARTEREEIDLFLQEVKAIVADRGGEPRKWSARPGWDGIA